ncbi:MAG: GGDEF domain-containing protein [Planctomycetota bacterium]
MSSYSITDIANTKRIPSLSGVAMRLLEVAQQEDPDFADVCRILRSDPAISGKVLQTVNSALYGFQSKIESIEQAVPKLGLSMIRTLVLSFHLADSQEHRSEEAVFFRKLWRSSLTQAVIAELIAEKTGQDPSSFFSAGMLQDIGIHAMAAEHFDEYLAEVFQKSSLPNTTEAELAHFGFDHLDVTIQILESWNLGEAFIEAVRLHHKADEIKNADGYSKLALALQAASLGSQALSRGRPKLEFNDSLEQFAQYLCRHLGINPAEIEGLVEEVLSRVEEYSVLFNFDIDNISSEQVTRRSKELLQQIAVDLQLKMVESRRSKAKGEQDSELFKDYLTGVYNTRFLNEKLRAELGSWVARRLPVAFLYVDIDEFKSINDNLGHRVGDQAIKHVSAWLDECTRKNDFTVRLGGDEFLVVAQVAEEDFQTIASRIAEETPTLDSVRGAVDLSLSVGCVFFQPKRGDKVDIDYLIDQADRQMYVAKSHGGHECSTVRLPESTAP